MLVIYCLISSSSYSQTLPNQLESAVHATNRYAFCSSTAESTAKHWKDNNRLIQDTKALLLEVMDSHQFIVLSIVTSFMLGYYVCSDHFHPKPSGGVFFYSFYLCAVIMFLFTFLFLISRCEKLFLFSNINLSFWLFESLTNAFSEMSSIYTTVKTEPGEPNPARTENEAKV
jgi:hypothetical protein